MYVKVELLEQPRAFILDPEACTPVEVAEFYETLEKEMARPFSQTQPVWEPDISRYMLRRFEFGRNMAIVAFVPARNLIKVVLCRRL